MSIDPLKQIEQISGINEIAILAKDGKRIVLLGDIHTPYIGLTCKQCEKACFTIKRFIRSLAEYHKNNKTEFDFYGEFHAPHGSSKDPEVLKQMIEIAKNEGAFLDGHDDQLVMYKMRREFAQEAYIHTAKSIRIHYVDVRTSPYLQSKGLDFGYDVPGMYRSPSLLRFFKLVYPTKEKLNKTIIDVCFKSKNPENKISKQYRKIPSTNDKKLVYRFITDRIKSIHYHYPYSDLTTTNECISLLQVLLVDCYTICRFLRFFDKQPKGSTSVFFEGVAHTWTVMEFLKLWKCNIITNTHPVNMFTYDYVKAINAQKCITLKIKRKHAKSIKSVKTRY